MTYYVYGFTPINISLQTAADNNGVPGTFGTFSGQTTLAGTNPNTSTTTATFVLLTGYQPWLRVSLNTATGSGIVGGVAFGWRNPSAGSGGGGGGGGPITSPLGPQADSTSVAVVTQGQAANGAAVSGNPVLIGGSDGTDVRTAATDIKGDLSSLCTNPATYQQALFNLSASGNTKIVGGTASEHIRVCHISFSTTLPEDIKLTNGTGTNCGSSTADLTGLYKSIVTFALDLYGELAAVSGDDLCINQTGSQALGGIVTYVVF